MIWPAFWETYMQVKKQQLELDMEQQTGSKLGKDYVKAVCCHSVYLAYIQSESESYSVMSNSLPPHGLYGIFQARILGWLAFPFSRRYSQPRDQTWVSCIAGRFFTIWATWEAPVCYEVAVNFPTNVYQKEWLMLNITNVLARFAFNHIVYSHIRMESGLICLGEDQIKLLLFV